MCAALHTRPSLDLDPHSVDSAPICYFTYIPAHSTHLSHLDVETPLTPLSAYSPDIHADPQHPLLAHRPLRLNDLSPFSMDASKLLQLQTAAAHARPRAQPLQQSGSVSSSNSSSSSESGSSSSSSSSVSGTATPNPPTLCCSRCRRTAIGPSGMVQFGTNLYYCSHCASITGYSAAYNAG